MPDLANIAYVSDPSEWLVLLRTPGLWRVLLPTNPDDSEEFIMDPANVEARLQAVLPTDRPYEVVTRPPIVCMSVWSTNIWTAAYSLPAMRHI